MYKLYKHTCIVTGLSYIGYTRWTIKNRWKQHVDKRNETNTRFSKALKKYKRWKHYLLKECKTLTEAKIYERALILMYDTYRNGLNMNPGGSGVGTHSARVRKQMAESRKGHEVSPETRKKISDSHKGLKHTPESIEKMRKVQKKSPEVRKKLSEALKGNIPWNKGLRCARS